VHHAAHLIAGVLRAANVAQCARRHREREHNLADSDVVMQQALGARRFGERRDRCDSSRVKRREPVEVGAREHYPHAAIFVLHVEDEVDELPKATRRIAQLSSTFFNARDIVFEDDEREMFARCEVPVERRPAHVGGSCDFFERRLVPEPSKDFACSINEPIAVLRRVTPLWAI